LPATNRKLVLIVVDGLTPSMFEASVGDARTPAMWFLAEHGSYSRAVTTFPSLTPVCMSSLVTGAHPDVHHIPHLVWWNRRERRLVEYGSSFAALRAAGMTRAIRDTIVSMNRDHLSREAVTVFETVEDAGLTAGAINATCYRGRTPHLPTLPGFPMPVYGPKRFFYYSLFESDATGAPLAITARGAGSIDAYAAAVGRWLVTRDGFDLLVYYLPDYDFASHAYGPDGAHEALARADAAIGALFDAAGGPDEFLARYAVVFCSDHGQTRIERHAYLNARFADLATVLATSSNRAGMIYRLDDRAPEARLLAERLDGEEAVEVVLFREGDEAVVRRDGEELRFAPNTGSWRTSGDASLLDHPDAFARAWCALQNPNAGDVIISAAPGYEFADLAGRHHVGGGSHGSLTLGDSEVPMLTIGVDAMPSNIVDVARAVARHFGLEPPAYQRDAASSVAA
jgi:predicted AlkP superfamily pyrophosphatase or phosphodiesterase